jgi:hypothetical protein
MSYTTLVNVDADTAVKLIDFIGNLTSDDAFKTKCNGLIEKSNGGELIELILSKESAIFGMEDELEIEGCVQTIVSVMLMFGVESDNIVQKFVSALVAKKGGDEDKVMLRLKLLVILFNMLSLAESKFAVICAIFNYALETNQEAEVVPFLDRGEKWAAAWKVDDSKRQQLALAIYKVADKVARSEEDISKGASNGGGLTTGASKNALKFLLSYLKSFPSGANLPDEAIQVTLPILVNSLKGSASSFEQRNALLEGLRGSPAGTNASEPLKSLIALLEIVCTGNQAQYDAFVKGSAGQKAMKEHGLNEADLAGTMRVLNLGALAAAKPRLTYAEISSALSLSSLDEVEMLVVEAIAQGVLEATMDQFDQVITITKSSHSTFGMAQWSELQIRLKALRANVSAVYDEIVKS